LFGAYHPPAPGAGRSGGVVLCHPFGHEYIRAHRTIRNLGARLSDVGLHVLRFDYFACGDSAGETEAGSIARWKSDIAVAIDELKDMASLNRVSIVGVRLGASLAALAAANRKDIEALVLWDPIARGGQYLQELADLQTRWLKRRPGQLAVSGDAPHELFGFPVSPALRGEFEALDLFGVPRWSARRHALVVTSEADQTSLAAHLEQTGTWTIERSEQDCRWRHPQSVHLQLLANETVQSIVRLFEQPR
jgi:pimeloyl-ACP methyl ester carboxylesterase